MSNGIGYAKHIIKKQLKIGDYNYFNILFSKYRQVYLKTNENIEDYLKIVDFSQIKKALTVLSSGDHPFNLAFNGVKEIETFDTNLMTEHYALGLKRAMIEKLSYDEFVFTMAKFYNPNTSLEEITTIILDLLPFMEMKSRIFWQKLAEFNYKAQKNCEKPLNLMLMLAIDTHTLNGEDLIKGNSYLANEDNYNKLKSIIGKININFQRNNAIKLAKNYNDKFDLILLSNILDSGCTFWGEYWAYSDFRTFRNELETILNDDGLVFYNYIFEKRPEDVPIIFGSELMQHHLKGEQLIDVKGIAFNLPKSAVLLARKKEGLNE